MRRRPLPEFPLAPDLTVTDYTVKHTDLETFQQPYELPPAPQMNGSSTASAAAAFTDPAQFVDAQLAAILEMFREETAQAAGTCGTKAPLEQHLHLRYVGVSTLSCQIVAAADPGGVKMHVTPLPGKFPPENARAVWNKFMLLVQCGKSSGAAGTTTDRVKNVAIVFCEAMNQKEGLVLRARRDVLDTVQKEMTQPQTSTYFRKLRNFNFMVTAPAASLQKLRTEPPSALCRQLFLGEQPSGQGVISNERMDGWVRTENPSLQLLFNPQQCRALALEALTTHGPVIVQGPPGMSIMCRETSVSGCECPIG